MRLMIMGVFALAVDCSTGCSFRPSPFVSGELTSLNVPSTASTQYPITVQAQARYGQRYANAALSVFYPTDGSKLLKLAAVADWEQPPMGLGVFAGLPFKTDPALLASITFEQPGTYTIEGLNGYGDPVGLAGSETIFQTTTVVVTN